MIPFRRMPSAAGIRPPLPNGYAASPRGRYAALLLSLVLWAAILAGLFLGLIVRFEALRPAAADPAPRDFVMSVPPPSPRAPPSELVEISVGSASPGHVLRLRPERTPPPPPAPIATLPRPSPDVTRLPDMTIKLPSVSLPSAPLLPPAASEGVGGPAPTSGIRGDGLGTGTGKGIGPGSGDRDGGYTLSPAQWIHKPSDQQIRAADPREARLARVTGHVMLSCLIDAQNRARHCRVLSETPRFYGFGSAALSLVSTFRIRVGVIDGRELHETPARIPIVFENR